MYQRHRTISLVQEKGFWCTKRDDVAGWYRRRGFGVPNAKMWQVGTGEGVLVYQRHRTIRLVQEKAYGVPKEE